MEDTESMATNLEKNIKTIVIPSSIEHIPEVEQFIDELLHEYKFSKEIYGNILISLIELTNNAIVHGNKKNPNKKVTITASIQNDQLICRVKDEGDGFDFTNLPNPVAKENIDKPFGRGIFFVKHLSDKCEFLNNGSTVEVHFNIK
jgi:serine/threonine-protein kinase RsbW